MKWASLENGGWKGSSQELSLPQLQSFTGCKKQTQAHRTEGKVTLHRSGGSVPIDGQIDRMSAEDSRVQYGERKHAKRSITASAEPCAFYGIKGKTRLNTRYFGRKSETIVPSSTGDHQLTARPRAFRRADDCHLWLDCRARLQKRPTIDLRGDWAFC